VVAYLRPAYLPNAGPCIDPPRDVCEGVGAGARFTSRRSRTTQVGLEGGRGAYCGELESFGPSAAGSPKRLGLASRKNPGRPPRHHYILIVMLSSATRTGLFAFFTS
jgi:hypothetical protein